MTKQKQTDDTPTKFYPDVQGNPDFPKLEEEVLRYWKEQDTFQKSVDNRPSKTALRKKNEFVFYDGPPFANGLPHYGHLLTGYVKDLVARYQTMKGKRTERRFGWDCHGLPAEMGAEKELGISGRHQIVEHGIDKFNDTCRTSVMKYTHEWEQYVNRQARWVDFENDYKTMDKNFMESVLWAFKQLYDKGLVYESMRVMPYSWACETPLSNFETRLDNSYREKTSKAVTVAFQLDERPEGAPEADVYKLLAWTTTPWTLPSNLALAVGEGVEYISVIKKENLSLEGELINPLSPSGERARVRGERSDTLTNNARELRQHSTDVEHTLWYHLRNRRFHGFKFRRQHDIDKYIADFACLEKNLIIELDGSQHKQENKKQYDEERTAYLESKGFTVLRFWNNEVIENLEGVLTKIANALGIDKDTPHPDPLPAWGEGEDAASSQKRSVCYILAKSALSKYAKEIGDGDEPIEGTKISGADLVGLSYKPLFPYFAEKKSEGAFKILAADFVTDEDGTGIVHLAPGFGEDDFEACKQAGIPMVCPVDNGGKFTAEIYDIALDASPHRIEHVLSPTPPQGGSERGYANHTLQNAQTLRKEMTDAERLLWSKLKNRQVFDYKFRRQQPIGNYIADFVCFENKLVVELDGGQHNIPEQKEYDQARTNYLESLGYKVLRYWNNDIFENLSGVVDGIYNVMKSLSYSPLEGESEMSSDSENISGGGKSLSLKGRQVFETNDDIIKALKAQGSWLKTEQYIHNYPHCWRTDTPLIYKAVPSWYVEVTKFKDRMVELNQQINWIPDHVKNGLFGKWLENARDWSISRNRFWGSPIPVWKKLDESGLPSSEIKVFGSIKELEDFFVIPEDMYEGSEHANAEPNRIIDLHRPYIDKLTLAKDGSCWQRVEDVFDCWFESGSMPYAQVHYPFENKDWFEKHFPADFIVEYTAQTRGWFYTLMVLATALFDKPPFLNVICHGVVLDEKGQKLSKRLNNYADPMDLFEKYGSDALRWVMVSAPIMRGGELLIDKEGNMVRDAVRLAIKPVWNAYSFFTLYANADGLKAEKIVKSKNLMDRYILAKCKQAVEAIEEAMDAYDTPAATRAVEQFFEVLNNWYIRRSKERFWKSEKDEDKQAAYNTLFSVLHAMTRAFAPLMPLISEVIYRGLTGAESVHLADFPDASKVDSEEKLVQAMDRVREVCNAALSIRNSENIRVRQPLSTLTIVAKDAKALVEYADVIRDEINVKHVEIAEDVEAYADYKLQINFPVLGKRLPQLMKQIIPASKKGEWQQVKGGKIEICGEVLKEEECSLQLLPKESKGAQSLASNDALVLLNLEITEDLRVEGFARDLVRLIQQSRKDADLNITDRIALIIEGGCDDIDLALQNFSEYIAEQTLAKSVIHGASDTCTHQFPVKIENSPIIIGFTVV